MAGSCIFLLHGKLGGLNAIADLWTLTDAIGIAKIRSRHSELIRVLDSLSHPSHSPNTSLFVRVDFCASLYLDVANLDLFGTAFFVLGRARPFGVQSFEVFNSSFYLIILLIEDVLVLVLEIVSCLFFSHYLLLRSFTNFALANAVYTQHVKNCQEESSEERQQTCEYQEFLLFFGAGLAGSLTLSGSPHRLFLYRFLAHFFFVGFAKILVQILDPFLMVYKRLSEEPVITIGFCE